MMGKGYVPSALWRCVTLLSFCTLLNAKEKKTGVELGPREPGDPKYWLHLKSIAFSEGELNPPFDGKLSDFSLTVKNPGVRSFTMTISLDLQHYDLLHLPKIWVDGKVLKYSPLDPIEIPIFVNDTIAALDRTVSITLEDPSGKKFGGFLGVGGKTRSWDYHIRCLQPPEFQKVVTINKIKVKNDKNEYLKPDKDPDLETGQYWLHDHPQMYVFGRLLFGVMRVVSFDLEDIIDKGTRRNPRRQWARVRSIEVHGPDSRSYSLAPDTGNLHYLEAMEDCCFFDVVTPPYNSEQGRECTYYQPQIDLSNAVAGERYEIQQHWPENFYTEPLRYKSR